MDNPRVYPHVVLHEATGKPCAQNEGIDLLTHVALQAMKSHWQQPEVNMSHADSVVTISFDLAEKFLKERDRRLTI